MKNRAKLLGALAFAGAVAAVSATTANLTVNESTSSYGAIADDGTRWSGGVAPKNSGDIALENFVIDTSAAPAKLVKKASWSIEIGEDGSKSLVLTMQKPGLMLIFR